MNYVECKERVEPQHCTLPVSTERKLVALPRSCVQHQGKPAVFEDDLAVMKRGSMPSTLGPVPGHSMPPRSTGAGRRRVRRKRIQRVMRVMGLATLYPKRRTCAPGPGHRIYAYRLRGLTITRNNLVRCADTMYIQVVRGFLVLATAWADTRRYIDWFKVCRGHSSLNGQTLLHARVNSLPTGRRAACIE